MSFESGSTSLRVFKLTATLPKDAVERLAANALPDLALLKDDPMYGWTSGRHILDREITQDTAYWGGYLRVHLVKAQKKIPSKLLKAEIRAAEINRLRATGQSYLSRAERIQLAQDTRDMLLPNVRPTLNAIQVIHIPEGNLLLTDALSDAAAHALMIQFRYTFGITIHPLDSHIAGVRFAPVTGAELDYLPPSSFSPHIDDKLVSTHVGHDFLTWLWHMSEAAPELLLGPDKKPTSVLVEGPLSFVMEGSGAHEISVRKGNPTVSREARACLLAGKKLSRCKLSLCPAGSDHPSTFNLDPVSLTLRGLRLPQSPDHLDAVSEFQRRITLILDTWHMLLSLYETFIRLRTDNQWPATVQGIRDWIITRREVA